MISKSSQDAFAEQLEATREKRKKTRNLVRAGKWADAEWEPKRRLAYAQRVERGRGAQEGGPAEREQGDTSDFQPVAFLSEGFTVRRAVAKVEVNTPHSTENGSGFLISPDLFLTNQHIIRDGEHAEAAIVTFDYEISEAGEPHPLTIFKLDPSRFHLASPEEELDFALVAIGRKVQGGATLADFGYCPISHTPDRHQIGINVNIIQHPLGVPKSIAVRNNLLTDRTDRALLYETDTLKGSSGSPVFNDDWDLIALHHYGEPSRERRDEDGNLLTTEVNEGIRISHIYKHLEQALAEHDLSPERRDLLTEALNLFEDSRRSLPRVGPRPAPSPQESDSPRSPGLRSGLSTRDSGRERSFVVPIEISVRPPEGCYFTSDSEQPQPGLTRPPSEQPRLSSAEGKKLDTDYLNRNGFAADFVSGVAIDLANIVQPLQARVTPLNQGQPHAARGELKYQNFSVIMDSIHRLAMITATNIDGEAYKTIDRKTGEVRAPEGESWYIERRIDRNAFVDQSFYGGWSHIFDRGHLTRRNDPTWGSAIEAKRANADTFHFTNCSPQQWRFNQTIEFWQGIERYVLEKGVFQEDARTNLSVLQGPVFDDAEDLFADDVQIPSSFWKLVIWRGADAPKAVALLASQAHLLDEFRASAGPRPDEDADVDVGEYRISIADLAAITELDLSGFVQFDTITDPNAPDVGAEAQRQPRRLRRWADIRL